MFSGWDEVHFFDEIFLQCEMCFFFGECLRSMIPGDDVVEILHESSRPGVR